MSNMLLEDCATRKLILTAPIAEVESLRASVDRVAAQPYIGSPGAHVVLVKALKLDPYHLHAIGCSKQVVVKKRFISSADKLRFSPRLPARRFTPLLGGEKCSPRRARTTRRSLSLRNKTSTQAPSQHRWSIRAFSPILPSRHSFALPSIIIRLSSRVSRSIDVPGQSQTHHRQRPERPSGLVHSSLLRHSSGYD